jgi:hypothetical protein
VSISKESSLRSGATIALSINKTRIILPESEQSIYGLETEFGFSQLPDQADLLKVIKSNLGYITLDPSV